MSTCNSLTFATSYDMVFSIVFFHIALPGCADDLYCTMFILANILPGAMLNKKPTNVMVVLCVVCYRLAAASVCATL